jgi:hypothetical protein
MLTPLSWNELASFGEDLKGKADEGRSRLDHPLSPSIHLLLRPSW